MQRFKPAVEPPALVRVRTGRRIERRQRIEALFAKRGESSAEGRVAIVEVTVKRTGEMPA